MPAPKGNQYAKGGPGGGRPSAYKKQYAKIAEKMCFMGATDDDLAEALGVSVRTIRSWKSAHQEFSAALKVGKDHANENVARSLYQRAMGCSVPDTDIRVIGGKIVITEIAKHYPPDPTSMIFWLKNRDNKAWSDKQEVELDVKHGLAERLAAARLRMVGIDDGAE